MKAMAALGGNGLKAKEITVKLRAMFPNDDGNLDYNVVYHEVAKTLTKLKGNGYLSCELGFNYKWTIIKELPAEDPKMIVSAQKNNIVKVRRNVNGHGVPGHLVAVPKKAMQSMQWRAGQKLVVTTSGHSLILTAFDPANHL